MTFIAYFEYRTLIMLTAVEMCGGVLKNSLKRVRSFQIGELEFGSVGF